MRHKALVSLAVIAALACHAAAQEVFSKPSWYISFFAGHSARILGSQDIRTNYGVGAAWAKPEPHFKWRHGPAQLVVEGYYEHSNGQQYSTRGRVTEAIGAIWYARFRFHSKVVNFYADIGEGAQLSTSESFDLGTRFNSSPMLGGGVIVRQGSRETLLGLRILHLSNAGLNKHNRGQNQILLYTSVRF